MPLIDDLEITLKDFLPDRSDGTIIRDGRGVIAMVSDRLFAALNAYATAHRLELNAVAQLRAEFFMERRPWRRGARRAAVLEN